MSETAHRVVRFIAVGCMAAAVHLAVVVLLVSGIGWPPLVANVVGWLVAFGFSLTGHRLLTFRSRRPPLWQAARRFFAVSAAGFCVNEVTYALLLRLSGWRYDIILAFVLVAVAFITYLVSSRWAFLGSPQH